MSIKTKKFICIFSLLFVLVASVFATNVSYRFKYVGEEEIDCFEYRFNDSNWKTIDKDQHKMAFTMSDNDARALKEDAFQIRSKKDDRVSVDVNGIPVRHNHAFNVSVLPYSIQIITESIKNNSLISKYGIGAEFSYQYFFFNNFYANTGLQWNLFFNPNEKPNVNSILGFAGFGYSFDFSEEIKLFTDINVGGDSLIAEGVFSETILYMLNAGAEYVINETLSAKLSCRGLFEYTQSDEAHYLHYVILPSLGMSFKLR